MKVILCWLALGGLPLSATPAPAQTPPLDSLRAQLQRPGLADTSRVLLHAQQMRLLGPGHTAAALAAGQRGLALARQAHYRYGQALLLWALGNTYFFHGDNLAALRYFGQVRQLGGGQRFAALQTRALEGMAQTYTLEHRFALALACLRDSKALYAAYPALLQPGSAAALENNYATLYLEWAEAGPVPDSVRRAALRHARRTLALYRRPPVDSVAVAGSYDALGEAYRLVGQRDSAAYCFHQTVALARQLGDAYTGALGLYHLAEARQQQGPARAALPAAREALALAQGAGQTELVMKSQQLLAGIYEAMGQLQPANAALRAYTTAHDTLTGQARREATARLSAEFDTERKEVRIKELTQAQRLQQAEAARQQTRLWGLLGGLGVLAAGLAVAAGLTVRLRRSRTALAARNEQLAQARATQDRLYSVIGHDLRTPLTALEGLATLIDYYYQPAHNDAAAMQEVTAEVRQTTSQLTGLLDNLLHWAAGQSGELAYRPEVLDAAALLQESAALYAPAARARQVTVQVAALPAGLPLLWADRNMVLTQLRNLLGNAVKLAPPGSAITLAAQPVTTGVELSVADQGPGLSAAQLATLAAAAGHDSLAPRLPGQRGTGLGLPLVRQLARRQQGTFALDSAPGRGTTARLGLPVAGTGGQ